MADIFVSYASEDRERVKTLVDALNREGYTVWWDRELITGAHFEEAIERAIEDARCVVVAWTEHSVKSRWCRAEATEGLERGILLPLRFDDARPPLSFRSSQTADLSGWPQNPAGLDALIRALEGLLGGRRGQTESASAPTPSELPTLWIPPTDVPSGDPVLEEWGREFNERLRDALGLLSHVEIVDADRGGAADATYSVASRLRRRRSTTDVRLSLIDNASRRQLWSGSADSSAPMDLDDEGLRDLVTSSRDLVGVALLKAEARRFAAVSPAEVGGWGHYMQGFFAVGDPVAHDRAWREERIARARENVRRSPDIAILHAVVAFVRRHNYLMTGGRDEDDARREALEHSQRAVSLAPEDPDLLAFCSDVQGVFGDVEIALQYASRAFELHPGGLQRDRYARALIQHGLFADAARLFARGEVSSEAENAFTCIEDFDAALAINQRLLAGEGDAFSEMPSILWLRRINLLGILDRRDEAEHWQKRLTDFLGRPITAEGYALHYRQKYRNERAVELFVRGLLSLGL